MRQSPTDCILLAERISVAQWILDEKARADCSSFNSKDMREPLPVGRWICSSICAQHDSALTCLDDKCSWNDNKCQEHAELTLQDPCKGAT